MDPALMEPKFFKGWAIPGPTIPASTLEPEAGETLDALSGHFKIFQLKEGHRFSTDDLLVAWYGTSGSPAARSALDLGSGIGAVGMVSAWRLQGTRFVTIEAQDESVRLARKSAALNGLESRYEIRHGDFRDPGILSQNELFDLVLGSPPYFPIGTGIESDHPQKQACRFELRGSIADYCQVASRHLAPGGVFACIFPVNPRDQEQRVMDAAKGSGFAIVKRRDVMLREGEPPLLGVFLMMREDHLPEKNRSLSWKEPELVIRRRDGSVHPEYSAIKLSIGFPP